MKNEKKSGNHHRFFIGLAIFLLSAGTVAFVTDPYLMADIALIVLGTYLMVTGLANRKVE